MISYLGSAGGGPRGNHDPRPGGAGTSTGAAGLNDFLPRRRRVPRQTLCWHRHRVGPPDVNGGDTLGSSLTIYPPLHCEIRPHLMKAQATWTEKQFAWLSRWRPSVE